MGGGARVKPPIKIMIDNKKITGGPTLYDEWLDLGYIIIPCKGGLPEKEAKGWAHPDFSIKKEEAKNTHPDCEIAVRLDNLIDLDFDNSIAKRFVDKYIITSVRFKSMFNKTLETCINNVYIIIPENDDEIKHMLNTIRLGDQRSHICLIC